MDFGSGIVAKLPYLRRFSRALTGSQKAGDAYVRAALEALAEDPTLLDEEGDLSVGLFRVLCRIWTTLDINLANDGDDDPLTAANADEHLATLKPRERMVFLLRMLEGFSTEATAEVMGISVDEVEELMAQANADIADQLKSRILIIEDESVTALDLSGLVTSLGHEVITIAKTHSEAVEAVGRERPDLILADVQLADGSSGIEAVNEILRQFASPVIFITGHPEFLLTGDRPEPTFLIAKPYDPEAVKAMVSQVLFFQKHSSGKAAAA